MINSRHRLWIALILFFSPILFAFITGEEYWPITSFPMYSKPYRQFTWPSVMVRTSPYSEWSTMSEERCFGRVGYVRFHFSALRFASERRKTALIDLTQSLIQEIHRVCGDRPWHTLKVTLLSYDVSFNPPPSPKIIRDLTDEVSLAQ